MPLMQEDHRVIPSELQNSISSPPQPIPLFSLNTSSKLALTNAWFEGKWTFVTFTHGHCLPTCQSLLDTIKGLKASLASNNIQFLVVGIDSDHESAQQLDDFLVAQKLDATAAAAESTVIDVLAHTFIALFLQTDYNDGSYIIEQEYHLFLVDPKGRLYAIFKPPYNSQSLKQLFFKLRYFYAKSE
ncbi:SCO family protein [Pseudomonadota bacterium]|nr:SCO family protein [Pseudomonadota bacterium]